MTRRDVLFICLIAVGLAGLITVLFQGRARTSPSQPPRADELISDEYSVSRRVDAAFASHWKRLGLQSADVADDLLVARRLSLALTGMVPSLEDVRRLQSMPAKGRLDWWISHLLDDRRSSDYLAERFARAFVGVDDGPFLFYRRRRFVFWLSEQLAQKRPYDEIVRQLVTESGLWTDSPSVNFYTVTFDNNQNQLDPIRLAGRVSRAFLGMRIDCLQCHDDQLGQIMLGTSESPREGLQRDFHRLAAFFSQTEASVFGVREVTDDQRQYEVKYLDAETENVVEPDVPFQRDLLGDSGPRRRRLSKWITHPRNRPFARTAVNRVWAILFGRPLTSPIDDIPLYEDPAADRVFPPAMELLADDFVAHDFDLHRLIRVIAATRVFRLESKAEFDVHPVNEKQWSVFPLTRLRPEQVAGSVIQGCSLQTIDAESHIFTQLARYFEENDFIRRYGDMGQDEFEERGGTIKQRLVMMNGKLVKGRTNQNLVHNAATQIATVTENDEKAVEATYLAVLARYPSQREQERFCQRLEGTSAGSRIQVMEDIFWVLLNSTEFSWNH